MYGCLGLSDGVVYVGRHARTARIQAFDLDGHRLGLDIRFAAEDGARASVNGIAIDTDRRLWVADGASARLRSFSLFGAELDIPFHGSVPDRCQEQDPERGELPDRPGMLGRPRDVLVLGEETEARVIVASGGNRRHALQVFATSGEFVDSLRPLGDPRGRFKELNGIAAAGRLVYACERRGGRVQVFRDGDFHFCIGLEPSGGVNFEPVAVAPLSDGRVVVGQGGEDSALCLVDAAGGLVKVIAEGGRDEAEVFQLGDVCVEEGADDRRTRVVALDCDGDRVQVFNLEGRCYGAFQDWVA